MLKTLVIGAQNIDIYVHAKSDYILHDSNQAKIKTAFGGVGRNIAVNLSTFGNTISFITVFGSDTFSSLAKKNLQDLNINIEESLELKDKNSSIYLGIMDKENDLFLGLNDMEIIESLDVGFFLKKTDFISQFDTIVIDNNLRNDALEYLLKTYSDKQIIMDAVSAEKATKLKGLLKYIDLLKLNRIELNALSDKKTIDEKTVDLLNQGLCKVIITNADQEIIYSSKDEKINTMPIKVPKIISSSGAGDAFLAGFTHGIIHKKSTQDCMEIAKKTACLTLQSPYSTNQNITKSDVE